MEPGLEKRGDWARYLLFSSLRNFVTMAALCGEAFIMKKLENFKFNLRLSFWKIRLEFF